MRCRRINHPAESSEAFLGRGVRPLSSRRSCCSRRCGCRYPRRWSWPCSGFRSVPAVGRWRILLSMFWCLVLILYFVIISFIIIRSRVGGSFCLSSCSIYSSGPGIRTEILPISGLIFFIFARRAGVETTPDPEMAVGITPKNVFCVTV